MARDLTIKRLLSTSTLVVALCMTFTSAGSASTSIPAGFDAFVTVAPANFDFLTVPNPQTVSFEGNPLGFFDFGAGLIATGPVDTIVQRIDAADLTLGGACGINCDTIDIEIVALSLVSIAPVDLGFGAGFEDLFVTLNTSSPSLQSTMTIFDTGEGIPHGTFDTELNFSFDVTGGVGGFYGTIEQTFNSSGTSWRHDHQAFELTIDGVNHNLNAGNPDQDFFLPPGEVLHTGPHPVVPTPEPGTGLLMGVGLIGMAAVRRRR